MHRLNSIIHYPASSTGCVLTIGNFDGLHLGHQSLIAQLIEKARLFAVPSVVLTFDPHPISILQPARELNQLYSREDLQIQLQSLGVDYLVLHPFTHEFSQLSALQFLTDLVMPIFQPREIVIGYDFHFGREREGSRAVLQQFAQKHAFSVTEVPAFQVDEENVSSSLIKKMILNGEIERANSRLGRDYTIRGQVTTGEARGRKMNLPTANIKVTSGLVPKNGVYATQLKIGKQLINGVTNIGHKPTFHENYERTIETHLFNFNQDILNESVQVIFHKRIRDELKFASVHDLINQINKDIQFTQNYFHNLR